MTTEQKYAELLKEVGELLHEKNNKIIVQKFQIEELERQLRTAQDTIIQLNIELNKEYAKNEVQHSN